MSTRVEERDREQSAETRPARQASVTLPLEAPVDTVWRALTDPEELVRWFPTNAAVNPQKGGAFVISWDGAWQWEMTIMDFEHAHARSAGETV